jgi:16S rRNA (guanine527-N7)-methyltransferase
LDLGSGGGIPGLVLAHELPGTSWVLLEASERRARFLREAVDELDLGNATVAQGRAEELARDVRYRFRFDMVVARLFGAPAVVAECAAGFLAHEGRLIVSEPPETSGRWPAESVLRLGMVEVDATEPFMAVLQRVEPLDERYPRRVGIPTKRPLF